MRDLQANPRFVIELVGGRNAETKLERTAEVRPIASAVGARGREWRHDEAVEGDVALKAAVAVTATFPFTSTPSTGPM